MTRKYLSALLLSLVVGASPASAAYVLRVPVNPQAAAVGGGGSGSNGLPPAMAPYTGANAGYALFDDFTTGSGTIGRGLVFTGASATCPAGYINMSSPVTVLPQIPSSHGSPDFYAVSFTNLWASPPNNYYYTPAGGYSATGFCAPVPDTTKLPAADTSTTVYPYNTGTGLVLSVAGNWAGQTAAAGGIPGSSAAQYLDLTAVGGGKFLTLGYYAQEAGTCTNPLAFAYAGPFVAPVNMQWANLTTDATLGCPVSVGLTGPGNATDGTGHTIVVSSTGVTTD